MNKIKLTEREMTSLYRDGFVILRNIIPPEMVTSARRKLNQHIGKLRQAAVASAPKSQLRELAIPTFSAREDPKILGLFNETRVKPTVEAFFGGPVTPARGAQIAATYPSDSTQQVNETGYRDCDTPFDSWAGHLDGLWNGGTRPPSIDSKLTAKQRRDWYQDPSTNGAKRSYPELNSNIANFTALVGIALSDQRITGAGNLGVLKGAHHPMGNFFKQQQQQGGPLGPDGPGWPRENLQAPNGHGLRHYPDEVREFYRKGSVTTEDGHYWPKPTLVKLSAGDAVIVHFAVPHSATRVTGPDPRLMVYFRTSPRRRSEPNKQVYPKALSDIWHEWRGMRQFIKQRP